MNDVEAAAWEVIDLVDRLLGAKRRLQGALEEQEAQTQRLAECFAQEIDVADGAPDPCGGMTIQDSGRYAEACIDA